jgi:hypothetical protein
MKISFITTVKLCKGYEWIEDALQTYVNVIEALCTVPYEILIGEDLNHKNVRRVHITGNHVRIIDVPATYPNPFDFNMIESYGKNACLREAKGEYVCMTSADQIFSNQFFKFLESGNLTHRTFYRFATYEIPKFETKGVHPLNIVEFCKTIQDQGRLCNPGCFDEPLKRVELGRKAGDIMLLDTESFRNIGGWPENECFHHVDFSVCMVAYNVFTIKIPPKEVCTYTFIQPERPPISQLITVPLEHYEALRAESFLGKMKCNE